MTSTIFSNHFLANRPIEIAMKKFGKRFHPDQQILDIGCGKMPYKYFFKCRYLGLDPSNKVNADIVANAWDIPQPDNTFDGIILNQSLEHIAETKKTIQEIHRLLKPGGYCLVTVPQTMKNHSQARPSTEAPVHNFDTKTDPHWRIDYYRFTRFGLIYLFKDFKILSLKETTGYFGTITQLINYFFASFPHDRLFTPIYTLNNIIGLVADTFLMSPRLGKFYHFAYATLTINYVLILKKP